MKPSAIVVVLVLSLILCLLAPVISDPKGELHSALQSALRLTNPNQIALFSHQS